MGVVDRDQTLQVYGAVVDGSLILGERLLVEGDQRVEEVIAVLAHGDVRGLQLGRERRDDQSAREEVLPVGNLYVRIHACMKACMYVCMYLCMHVCISQSAREEVLPIGGLLGALVQGTGYRVQATCAALS